MSGQQVSQEKTSLVFSENVCSQVRQNLVMMSGFNEASSLGYLEGQAIVLCWESHAFEVGYRSNSYLSHHDPENSTSLYIWGDDDSGRKYHAVSWESVSKPKAYGGLGLRRLVHMNTACLMKLGWASKSGKEALWIDVIKGEYGRGNSNFEHVEAKTHDSRLLKSLVKLWREDFDAHEFWSVRNGNSVNAWKDRWLFRGKYIEEMAIIVPGR
ncbi:hypothetical protein L195_g003270 [Trifolium pratense]|uniref:Cysteine-rich receptor-like protein kinase n=1 Tax=Trifolium pratense TaxID=57577 RepID=A0A2K3NUU7_TRIPR|nr:hypothetical protein L195_g003270 [Trifolium pratense]